MITLIHGPAELLRAEALSRLRDGIAEDPSLAELNTTVLDGRQATLDDLQFACGALPFLAERRLVVVERLLARLAAPAKARSRAPIRSAPVSPAPSNEEVPAGSDAPGGEASPLMGQAKAFLQFLDQVPETTELVLVEEETVTSGVVLRRLIELAREGWATLIPCEKPRRSDLPNWIRARARVRHVQLDVAAVTDLAEFVGDDLRQLDQELIKLRDYVGGERPVSQADVRRLVPATRAANVFEMVDALAVGNGAQAGRLLRHALDVDGEEPLGLLALFGRRYRQLVQIKALQTPGSRVDEVIHQMGLPDWQARRLLEQAARQNPARLHRALEYILAADESIKTGRCSDREAMDILLAQLAGDVKG